MKTKHLISVAIICTILFNFLTIHRIASQNFTIDPKILSVVVRIQTDSSIGTGFIVYTEKNSIPNRYFLVTNKHVLGDWDIGKPFIPLKGFRVNWYSLIPEYITFAPYIELIDSDNKLKTNVKAHPNLYVDVVVIEITKGFKDLNDKKLTEEVGYPVSKLVPYNGINNIAKANIGELVFALGYPAAITTPNTNKPIAQAGYISSHILDEQTKLFNPATPGSIIEGKIFLVDALVTFGNSGGPIITPNVVKVHPVAKGKPTSFQNRPTWIIGIVSWAYPNTGISAIYGCDYITDLIKSFE